MAVLPSRDGVRMRIVVHTARSPEIYAGLITQITNGGSGMTGYKRVLGHYFPIGKK